MIDNKIFDLSGKVVLVTGGSRGLGRAFAEAASAFGANVVIAAREQSKIDDTLKVLAANKHQNLGISADMTKDADIQKMVDETLKKFGRIDVLFNNAGTTRPQRPIHEEIVADFDFIINSNLRAPFLVLKAVLPVMIKQNKGVVVNVSSTAGLRAEFPEIAPIGYCAAKAGINIMTQIAALEYAKYNIRVNCIAPGIHHSELNRGHQASSVPLTPQEIAAREERTKMIYADLPLGRFGNAEELAGLAVLLASDASSYITGQVFAQDGGRSIKH
jgi:NAD(P)-dependent dehydrogenase (short-subunit alcohol dehydrogenase family)